MSNDFISVGSFLLAGGSGALVKEILFENSLALPRMKNGKLILGFLGSVIIGAAVGYLVDHSPLMAFFAGYTGFSAVTSLVPKKFELPKKIEPAATPPADVSALTIPEIIKRTCDKFGVSYKLALAVAKCESGLQPKARGKNTDGSVDRGLYQINSKWHPNVSDAEADDPVFASEFFCTAVLAGNLKWWNASKKCWGSAQY